MLCNTEYTDRSRVFSSSVDLHSNVHIPNFMNQILNTVFSLVQDSFLKNGKICCLEHPSGSPCQLSWTLSESHPCSSSGLLGSNIYWYLGRIREPGLSHPCPTKLHFHQLAQTLIYPACYLVHLLSSPHESNTFTGRSIYLARRSLVEQGPPLVYICIGGL